MSTTIDQNVVEMRFENGQFEQGVSQSMASIDKLKQSLNFDTAGAAAAQGINVVVQGFDTINYALANLVSNLANSAWSKLISFVKSLSVDNVAEGWSKYTTLMDGVQVIMSATRDQWEDQNAQMEYMTQQMEKLNWYTDETSWNMVDMTSNIGKFISAGVDIDTATTAMMGIGSWAGQSGAKVDQMSRAMYNLSQAMGMGSVRVQDWMSIENANMATKEFKETVIATALEMGELKYNADGDIIALDKFGKEIEVTAESFRSTLAAGWFTGDVLTSTLKRYGDFAEGLHKTVDETGLTAAELLGHIEEYKQAMADGEDMTAWVQKLASDESVSNVSALREGLEYLSNDYNELGYAAFKASQETRTFKDLQLAMKDAVSSAWMGIFQVIFGNYLESKELWSTWAEELYEVFVDPLNEVKRILDKAFNYFEASENFLQAMWNMWYNIKGVVLAVGEGFASLIPDNIASKILYFSEDLLKITEKMKLADFGWYSDFDNIKDAVSALMGVVKNFWKNIQTIAGSLGDAWKRIFPKDNHTDALTFTIALKNVAEWLEKVSEKFVLSKESAEKLERTFAGVFAVLDILKELLFALIEPFADVEEGESGLVTGTLSVTATIGDWLVMLRDWIKENDIFKKAVTAVVDFIKSIPSTLDKVCNDLFGIGLEDVWNNIKNAVIVAWGVVVEFFRNLPTYADEATMALFGLHLDEVWDKIKEAVSGAWEAIKKFFASLRKSDETTEAGDAATDLSDTMQQAGEGVSQAIEKVSGAFDKLKEAWNAVKPYIDQIVQGFKDSTDFEMPSMEEWGKGLAGGGVLVILVAIADGIMTFVSAIKELDKDRKKIVDSISGMFNSIGGAFNSLSKRISADVIKTIATAILELAAAIFILSLIDTGKMGFSTLAIGGLMAEIALIMEEFDSLDMDRKKFFQIKMVLAEMMLVIGEIVAGMILIAKEDPVACAMAASEIGILLLEIAAIMAIFNNMDLDEQKLVEASIAMVLLGAVMMEIGTALSTIGDIPLENTLSGSIALSSILAVLTICMLALGESKGNLAKAGASAALMGLALMEIAVALAIVGGVDPEGLLAGALAISGVLAVLTIALMALGEAEGNIVKGAAALLLASASLIIIAGALAIVNQVVESGAVIESLLSLAAALAIVLVAGLAASYIIPGLEALGIAIALIGVGALAAGAGMFLFAEGVQKLVDAGPGAVDVMIDGLSKFFAMIPTIATKVGQALVNMIRVFIDAKDTILEGLVTFFDIILEALTQSVPKFLTLVETIVVGILDMLINLVPKLFEFLTVFFDALWPFLMDQSPKMVECLIALVHDSLVALIAVTDDITKAAIAILIDLLENIRDNLAEVISLSVEIAFEVVMGLLDGFAKSIPKFAEAGMDFLISVLNGLADAVDKKADDIRAAMVKFATALLNAFKTFFGIHSPSTVMNEQGVNIVQGLIDGIAKMIEDAKKIITELADKILTKICDFFGVKKPQSQQELFTLGKTIIDNMISGISSMIENAKKKIAELADKVLTRICEFFGVDKPRNQQELFNVGKKIIDNMIDGISNMIANAKIAIANFAKNILDKVFSVFGLDAPTSASEFFQIGKNIIDGFVQGVKDKMDDAIDAIKDVCDEVVSWAEWILDINSPSKVFANIGRYVDMGFAKGITDNAGMVGEASGDLGQEAVDSLSSAIESISDIIDDMIDGEPTIRPVLDLSGIAEGARTIDGMLASDKTMNLAATSSMDVNRGIVAKHESVSAIESLRASLSGMSTSGGNTTTQNNTFNISGSNPKEIADEINKILQEQMVREDSVWA